MPTSEPDPWWKRGLWAAVACAAFTLPIAWTLASPPALDTVETPMAPEGFTGERLTIPFSDVSPEHDNERVHRLSLTSPEPMDILQHPEIRMLFSLDELRLQHPASGRLEVVGTPCVYDTPPGAGIADGRTTTFVRAGRCRPTDSHPTGELKLTVAMAGPGDLRVSTRALPQGLPARGLMYVRDHRSQPVSDLPLAVQGVFVDYLPDGGLRRAHLLSYVWTGTTSLKRLCTALAAVAVLLFAGALVLPIDERSPRSAVKGVRFAGASAGAMFCLAAALALSYAIVVPPMLAADETFHLGSYAEVTGNPSITTRAIPWAAVNQVARIRGHADQQFRPRDIGQPDPAYVGFDIHQTLMRSSLTARFWRVLGRILPPMPTPRLFATMRVIYVLLFASAVALAAALFVMLTQVRYPQLLVFPFLFVPAIPFFGMIFGESALVTSASVIFAATLVIIFLDGDQAHWIGLPLGLAAAALLVGARNSLPMMFMAGTALSTRIVLGPRDREHSPRKALVFWGGFALGASTFSVVLTQAHRDIITATVAAAIDWVPPALRPPTDLLTRAWFPLAIAAVGWVVEIALRRPRAAASKRLKPTLESTARWLPVCAAILILVSMIGSLWWEYPIIEGIQVQNRPPLRSYVLQVAATMATFFRLTHPSLLASSSFWVGFGWLDTIPGPAFVGFLVGVTGLALIGLLLHIAQHRDVRRFMALAIIEWGAAVTVIAYAYSAYSTRTNLHGRYLIGWYLSAIAIGWAFPAMAEPVRAGRFRGLSKMPRSAWLLALMIVAHTYSLCFILRRYF